MTVKVKVDWNKVTVKLFATPAEAFQYAQTMRECGFSVEVN